MLIGVPLCLLWFTLQEDCLSCQVPNWCPFIWS